MLCSVELLAGVTGEQPALCVWTTPGASYEVTHYNASAVAAPSAVAAAAGGMKQGEEEEEEEEEDGRGEERREVIPGRPDVLVYSFSIERASRLAAAVAATKGCYAFDPDRHHHHRSLHNLDLDCLGEGEDEGKEDEIEGREGKGEDVYGIDYGFMLRTRLAWSLPGHSSAVSSCRWLMQRGVMITECRLTGGSTRRYTHMCVCVCVVIPFIYLTVP